MFNHVVTKKFVVFSQQNTCDPRFDSLQFLFSPLVDSINILIIVHSWSAKTFFYHGIKFGVTYIHIFVCGVDIKKFNFWMIIKVCNSNEIYSSNSSDSSVKSVL